MTEFPELILTILTLTILTKNWGELCLFLEKNQYFCRHETKILTLTYE